MMEAERGELMKTMRKRKGYTLIQAANEAEISDRTLRRIEQGKDAYFTHFLSLLQLYGANVDDMVKLFGVKCVTEKVEKSAAYDTSDGHYRRLLVYSNMRYNCIYMSTKNNAANLCKLVLQTGTISKDGYLPGKADFDGYEYECKIVSPPDSDYTFLYMTSQGNLRDRALLILPYNKKIKNKLRAAVGKMLSLSMDLKAVPCFQKFLIISDEYEYPQGTLLNQLKTCFLKLTTLMSDSEGLYKVSGADLQKQSSEFYRKVREELQYKSNGNR